MSEFDTHDYPPEEGALAEESAEDYEPDEQIAAVSADTGTVYDEDGEAEITPHDLEFEDEDDAE